MVVVGTGEEAQAFADAVERHREFGIEVVGHLRAPGEDGATVTRPVIGDAEDLGRIFHERVIDEVALCTRDGSDATGWAEAIIALAADEGKHVRVPAAVQLRPFDLQVEELDGLLIRSYVHGPTRMLSLAVKRAMDVVGAAVGLVLPELNGKLDGFAVRVPTINVSLVDLVFTAARATSVEEVNAVMKAAAAGELKECSNTTRDRWCRSISTIIRLPVFSMRP